MACLRIRADNKKPGFESEKRKKLLRRIWDQIRDSELLSTGAVAAVGLMGAGTAAKMMYKFGPTNVRRNRLIKRWNGIVDEDEAP
jgi:hypothetical protein